MSGELDNIQIRMDVLVSGHPSRQTAFTHIKYILDASKTNGSFWQGLKMTRLDFKIICRQKWDINIDNIEAVLCLKAPDE